MRRLLIGLIVAWTVSVAAVEVTFTEDTVTGLHNPERGWFRSVEPTYHTNSPADRINGDVLDTWRAVDGITVVRKYYLLRPWRTSDLPQSVLDDVAADIAICRAKGFKLIPRFMYNFNQSHGSEDATETWTRRHIQQVGTVLRADPGPLDHVHAGFIGKWGEMHSSTNGHVLSGTTTLSESGKRIIDEMIAQFPSSRMVALRYPTFKVQFFSDPIASADAYLSTKQARLGGFNDGILYDSTDFGTFSVNASEQAVQRAWWAADCDRTVMSGEPAGATGVSWRDPIPALSALRFASLNMDQSDARDQGLYEWWKTNGDGSGASHWQRITKLIGYRFVLVSASVPTHLTPGASAMVTIVVRNDGMAALHNPRDVRLMLISGSTAQTLALASAPDPRRWRPGQSTTLSLQATVPVGLAAGSYELHLALPDPAVDLAGDPRFAIRCANTGVWDSAHGSHRLAVIEVAGTGAPDDPVPAPDGAAGGTGQAEGAKRGGCGFGSALGAIAMLIGLGLLGRAGRGPALRKARSMATPSSWKSCRRLR